MLQGYILIDRSIVHWRYYTDLPARAMYVHCIIMANFRDMKWNNITIKRGQFATTLDDLHRETGLSLQQIRTAMKKLKRNNDIDYTSTSKFTLITVCNYDSWQAQQQTDNKPITDGQQTNNRPATNEQQTKNKPITITEEYKNDKNDKDITEEDKSSLSDSSSDDSEKTDNLEENLTETEEEKSCGQKEEIDYDAIADFWNSVTNGIWGDIIKPIGKSRRKMIRARIKTYGKKAFASAIRMATESTFLKEWNGMSFDWLIKPTNFEKIIGGNYNNRNNNQKQNSNGTISADDIEAIVKLGDSNKW